MSVFLLWLLVQTLYIQGFLELSVQPSLIPAPAPTATGCLAAILARELSQRCFGVSRPLHPGSTAWEHRACLGSIPG